MGPTRADAIAMQASPAAAVVFQGGERPRAPAPDLGVSAAGSSAVQLLGQDRPSFDGLFQRADLPEGLVDAESVKRIVEQLNQVLDVVNNKIRFRVSDMSGRLQVQIIDPDTNKVIKTVPPDRAQVLADRMSELSGLLVDETR